jgi:hypothetical protein
MIYSPSVILTLGIFSTDHNLQLSDMDENSTSLMYVPVGQARQGTYKEKVCLWNQH